MKLSIVTSLYNSAIYIPEFYSRIKKEAVKFAGEDYELIFVDDGSPDDSLKIALDLFSGDKHVKIVELSRNFGHHNALICGLEVSSGKFIFLIDVDLEESPEWLYQFGKIIINDPNCDTVYGIQAIRRGSIFEKFFANTYYFIFRTLSGLDLPQITTARLMTRRYLNAFLSHKEREIILGGVLYITGFKQVQVPVLKLRLNKTNYSTSRVIDTFINSITSSDLLSSMYKSLFLSVMNVSHFISFMFDRYFSEDLITSKYET